MAKKENIKKKQIDYMVSLKAMTKYLTNKNKTDEQLRFIVERFKIENNVIKRILSYNYGFPYIIKYFNDYFNNLFDFDRFDTVTLIKSISYIMDINRRSDSKSFMYLKSNELKDSIKEVIKELIKEYLSITYNIECNRKELNFYYKLFKIGYISDEDLLSIDRHLNGDNTKIKNLDSVNYRQALNLSDSEVIETDSSVNLMSDKIIDFITSVKNFKAARSGCQSCPLFSKTQVILDTNTQDLGEVDITFIGLNPGVEEAKLDKPFIGDSGKEIRFIINQLPSGVKWLIFNIILCSTPNKNDIGDVSTVVDNCLELTQQIFVAFPSKIYIPVGDDAKKAFGIEESITQCTGKVYESDGSKIIPLIHPSAVLRNSKFKSMFDKSVDNIFAQFSSKENPQRSVVTKNTLPQDKMVTEANDLLFVDCKRIGNNQLLMIYTDLAGNKKYQLKEYKLPVNIKNKDWTECSTITNKINQTVWLNDYEKTKLSQKCHHILSNITTI